METPTSPNANEILKLRSKEHEKRWSGTICWVEKEITNRLKGYMQSPEIKKLCGGRISDWVAKILVWYMDASGGQ